MSPRRSKSQVTGTVRRSFALPRRLLDEVREATPAEGPGNLNALVRAALEEYVAHRREEAFAGEMARMARDPEVRRASREMEREGRGAEGDGL